MSDDENFEETMRAIAQEISKAVGKFSGMDIESALSAVAREFRGGGEQSPPTPAPAAEPARDPAEPHPLDTPTDEQGLALAALDSGRWSIEPGTDALTAVGDGPGPRDALGLVRELRVRDWLAADGGLTLTGHRALERWLAR